MKKIISKLIALLVVLVVLRTIIHVSILVHKTQSHLDLTTHSLFAADRKDVHLTAEQDNCIRYSLHCLQYSLQKFSDKHKNILISYVDYGYIDLAYNLFMTSYDRLSIVNYLFISSDNTTCNSLLSHGIHCLHYISDVMDGSSASQYRSTSFNLKSNFATI